MSTVHICPQRDIECGDHPAAWCVTCPKAWVCPWDACNHEQAQECRAMKGSTKLSRGCGSIFPEGATLQQARQIIGRGKNVVTGGQEADAVQAIQVTAERKYVNQIDAYLEKYNELLGPITKREMTLMRHAYESGVRDAMLSASPAPPAQITAAPDQAIEHVRHEPESLDTSEREAVEPKP